MTTRIPSESREKSLGRSYRSCPQVARFEIAETSATGLDLLDLLQQPAQDVKLSSLQWQLHARRKEYLWICKCTNNAQINLASTKQSSWGLRIFEKVIKGERVLGFPTLLIASWDVWPGTRISQYNEAETWTCPDWNNLEFITRSEGREIIRLFVDPYIESIA